MNIGVLIDSSEHLTNDFFSVPRGIALIRKMSQSYNRSIFNRTHTRLARTKGIRIPRSIMNVSAGEQKKRE